MAPLHLVRGTRPLRFARLGHVECFFVFFFMYLLSLTLTRQESMNAPNACPDRGLVIECVTCFYCLSQPLSLFALKAKFEQLGF